MGGWREEEVAVLAGSASALYAMQFKCCGSNNHTDWADSLWIKSPEANGRKVPDSCCKTITDLCGRRDHPSNIYKEVKTKRASEPLVTKYVKEVGRECWVMAANCW